MFICQLSCQLITAQPLTVSQNAGFLVSVWIKIVLQRISLEFIQNFSLTFQVSVLKSRIKTTFLTYRTISEFYLKLEGGGSNADESLISHVIQQACNTAKTDFRRLFCYFTLN